MKIGKVPESILKRSILKQIKNTRKELVVGPSVGEDSTVLSLKEEKIVLSTQPITGKIDEIGKLAVLFAANNLAAEGATPIGIMVTLLLPLSFTEQKLKRVIKDLQQQCEIQNMAVLGGHTETIVDLPYPILSVTGVGRENEYGIIKTSGMEVGDDLILTKFVGIYGTAKLVREREAELLTRYVRSFLEDAKKMEENLSIVREAEIAQRFGVSAMHDLSRGGVFAALWEMAEASCVGVEVFLSKIPIRQHTVEVCEFFRLNPYQILSNGSLLIAAKHGSKLVEALEEEGISATIIGRATKGKDRVVYYGEEKRFLERPKGEEFPIPLIRK